MTREEQLDWLCRLRSEIYVYMPKEWLTPMKNALDMAIKALEQEPNTWSLDDAREDFVYDVYNTLDFLPTNEEANRIIDSFDRVTSSIKQEPILDKISAEIMQLDYDLEDVDYDYDDMAQTETVHIICREQVLQIIDKYKAGSEGNNV